jgi:PIN domain nuclease of toxin-antitoxin system
MRYLLDTHAFLWFISDDSRLSRKATSIIRKAENEIFLSTVSVWEIAIKTQLGRLQIEEDVDVFILSELEKNTFLALPITIPHAAYITKLPDIHKDPFDRMLIAQSTVENMALISGDQSIRKYSLEIEW